MTGLQLPSFPYFRGMAILKFRIYWEEDDSVYRDVAVKHSQTFFELHEIILNCWEFDNKHKATFFRSNDKWQRGKEITIEKYDKQYSAPPLIMSETTIGSEIKDTNQKFIYVYDFNKNWTFMVELINVNKDETGKTNYPVCVRKEGIGPSQYGTKGLISEKLAEIEEKYDLNAEALLAMGNEGEDAEGTSDEAEDEGAEDTTAEEEYK